MKLNHSSSLKKEESQSLKNSYNFIAYLEAISKDITDVKRNDIKKYIWIVFDLETTGLIGSQGLKLTTGEKKYDPVQKRMRNVYTDKDLEIAEIAIYAYDPVSKKRFSFHEFLKSQLSPEIKTLISWDDMKEKVAKDSLNVLRKLNRYLGLIKDRKKIIIAHNGHKFDFKIMSLIGQKFNLQNIKEAFSLSPDENTVLIDTKQTQKIRQKLANLPWPKKINEKGKEIEVNRQDDLLKMFGIQNIEAHTAIADVSALARYLLKILRMLTKK